MSTSEITDAIDVVTGAHIEIEVELPVAQARLWELITDVTRIGEWSPETAEASWLDDAPVRAGIRVGTRFAATNRFRNGFVGEVVCEVTEYRAPARFGWKVLGNEKDWARPGSLWHYELAPGSRPGTVLVRHGFEHGPGHTGLRAAVDEDPERGPDTVALRLQQVRGNMLQTLIGMVTSLAA